MRVVSLLFLSTLGCHAVAGSGCGDDECASPITGNCYPVEVPGCEERGECYYRSATDLKMCTTRKIPDTPTDDPSDDEYSYMYEPDLAQDDLYEDDLNEEVLPFQKRQKSCGQLKFWPRTNAGGMAVIKCRGLQTGNQTRRCWKTGRWSKWVSNACVEVNLGYQMGQKKVPVCPISSLRLTAVQCEKYATNESLTFINDKDSKKLPEGCYRRKGGNSPSVHFNKKKTRTSKINYKLVCKKGLFAFITSDAKKCPKGKELTSYNCEQIAYEQSAMSFKVVNNKKHPVGCSMKRGDFTHNKKKTGNNVGSIRFCLDPNSLI